MKTFCKCLLTVLLTNMKIINVNNEKLQYIINIKVKRKKDDLKKK